MSFNTYFSSKYILSRGCLFNAVLSDRSDGKTTDVKINVLLDYLKYNEISMVVRRYKTEISATFYENFFGVLFANPDSIKGITDEERELIKQAKNRTFRYSKDCIKIKHENDKEYDVVCFFTALTMSGKKKSAYDSYSKRMRKIYFDEYIPLDGRYAVEEMNLLNELYKSIDRDRETTQLLLLGNKIDLFNPFFDFFNIQLDITNGKLRTYRNNTLAVQIYVNKEHRESRETGKLTDLFTGTEYADYNAGNILNKLLIPNGSIENARYWGSFKSELGDGSIWYNGTFIISTRKRKDGFVITDKLYKLDREQYIANFGKIGTLFRSEYRAGRIKFESEQAFHLFEPILRKAGT